MYKRKRWTVEELTEAVNMFKSGYSPKKIANILERSKDSINTKFSLLRVATHVKNPEELRRIVEIYHDNPIALKVAKTMREKGEVFDALSYNYRKISDNPIHHIVMSDEDKIIAKFDSVVREFEIKIAAVIKEVVDIKTKAIVEQKDLEIKQLKDELQEKKSSEFIGNVRQSLFGSSN